MTGAKNKGQVRSVNSQITDAISQTNTLTLGLAPAQAIGTLYQTTAQAVGASMQNAVANQQNLQSLNMAALTQHLQAILTVTAAGAHPASPQHLPRARRHRRVLRKKADHHMAAQPATRTTSGSQV